MSAGYDACLVALAPFPQVVQMMIQKPDWTKRLGQLFATNRDAVFDSIQRLRAQAQAAGNLKSTSQQEVLDANDFQWTAGDRDSTGKSAGDSCASVQLTGRVHVINELRPPRPLIGFSTGVIIGALFQQPLLLWSILPGMARRCTTMLGIRVTTTRAICSRIATTTRAISSRIDRTTRTNVREPASRYASQRQSTAQTNQTQQQSSVYRQIRLSGSPVRRRPNLMHKPIKLRRQSSAQSQIRLNGSHSGDDGPIQRTRQSGCAAVQCDDGPIQCPRQSGSAAIKCGDSSEQSPGAARTTSECCEHLEALVVGKDSVSEAV